MFNCVTLAGIITSDVSLKRSQNGLAVLSFTLETSDRYWKDGEPVQRSEHHRIVMFGPNAEAVEPKLTKHCWAFVSGKIRTRKYTDRDGQEKYITEIQANRIENMMDDTVEGEPPVETPRPDPQPQQQQQYTRPAPQRQPQPGWDTPPEDLPFN